MKQSRLLVTVALGLGLILALLWILQGSSDPALAENDPTLTPLSLDRQHEPVVVTGGLLSDLTGDSLSEIFVYAYRGTALTQIPFQIDERDEDGMYVPVEDGQLDDNDELVFMAIDGGSWIGNPSLDVDGTRLAPVYVVTLTDPISRTHAWAYVFHSGDLTYAAANDYVSYDDGNDRITSSGRYALGFEAVHGFMDYLTLGEADQDLLDRSKLRLSGTVDIFGIPVPFSLNEQDLAKEDVHAIDGPVRVVRVSTSTIDIGPVSIEGKVTLFAYRSLVVLPEIFTIPGDPVHAAYQRASMDWNEHATGMTFYDANNPAGVTVDGGPDVITTTPVSRWGQVTGVTGTLVSVSDVPAGIGETVSTYYKDDARAVDAGDTGDQLSYGDAGFEVHDPNPGTYTLLGHTYFLTGLRASVGTAYADYYDNPIQVSVAPVIVHYAYLPFVVKNY